VLVLKQFLNMSSLTRETHAKTMVTAWSSASRVVLRRPARESCTSSIWTFYRYCDERFGADAFDEGMSTRDAEGVMLMVESFYLTTTSDPA
jgi:hypothetical protein